MASDMAEYCAAVKQPVLELMTAAFDMSADPGKAAEIIRIVDQILAADSLRPAPRLAAEIVWAERGIDGLRRLRDAAVQGNAQQVWAIFTDKVSGMYLLGNACQGQPGW